MLRMPPLARRFIIALLGALVVGSTAAATPWEERTIGAGTDFRAVARAIGDAATRAAATDALIARGHMLFKAKFTRLDGAGRPNATQAIIPTKTRRPANQTFQRTGGPDANSCAGCHNDPVTGGAGEFVANAFVSEGFESAGFDTLDPQFSNERNTNHLFGAGLVELLAREMTRDLHAVRTEALRGARTGGKDTRRALETKGVSFGHITARPNGLLDLSEIDGVDEDLVIRPFSQKGVFGGLRQFTINALNHHHGIQATERFGTRWTGSEDFDGDGVGAEIGAGDISALVAFQATLPPPSRRTDLTETWRAAAARGEAVFTEIGCAACHRPALPLESAAFHDPGGFDTAGTLRAGEIEGSIAIDLDRDPRVAALPRDDKGRILVPLFGDLKRHVISDAGKDALGNELLAQRFVARDVFITAELWGVGSTAPYGHRGDMTTLDEVIRAHGGAARPASRTYEDLSAEDRSAIIAFLKTLTLPAATERSP